MPAGGALMGRLRRRRQRPCPLAGRHGAGLLGPAAAVGDAALATGGGRRRARAAREPPGAAARDRCESGGPGGGPAQLGLDWDWAQVRHCSLLCPNPLSERRACLTGIGPGNRARMP